MAKRQKDLEVLKNVAFYPERIETIKLSEYNDITKEDAEFVNKLFRSTEAEDRLFQAFLDLDLAPDSPKGMVMTLEEVSNHLILLIPTRVVKYGPDDPSRGKIYGPNSIAINEKLLQINPMIKDYQKNRYIARLAMTIIHEIAHSKRRRYCTKEPTPQKFGWEAVRYVKGILFGFGQYNRAPGFYDMSSNMADAFLNLNR